MHIPVGIGYITIRRKGWNNGFGKAGIRANKDGTPRAHDGWDIACPIGSPVYAVLDGQVVFVQTSGDYGGYGLVVLMKVEHGGVPYHLLYAHLKSVSVAVGEQVVEGQRLGLSGQTGKTAEGQPYQDAHLHFEVRTSKGGPAIDPGILLGHGAIGDVLNAELKEALLSGAGS